MWIAVVFVLHYFMIMKGDADDEGAYECSCISTTLAIGLSNI